MIGQEEILKKFNTFENIPSAVILFGPKGFGKKTLVKTLSDNIGIRCITIDKFSNDIKSELATYSNPAFILVNLSDSLTTKQLLSLQNSSLKFIEELPSHYKLFILANNESYILDTILNRCYIQPMLDYSVDELILLAEKYNKKILDQYDQECFNYLHSPIDIINAPDIDELRSIENLVDTIFSSIGKANISNILSISKKINFNNEIGLYNINIFMNIFIYKIVNLLKINYDSKYFDIFLLFNKLSWDISKPNSNKINLFENFLLDIKQILA